jgi:hypothetical protein
MIFVFGGLFGLRGGLGLFFGYFRHLERWRKENDFVAGEKGMVLILIYRVVRDDDQVWLWRHWREVEAKG